MTEEAQRHVPETAKSPSPQTSHSDAAETHFSPKIVHFTDLARCGGEVWIEYQGKLYRLQSTRQGKLILTK